MLLLLFLLSGREEASAVETIGVGEGDDTFVPAIGADMPFGMGAEEAAVADILLYRYVQMYPPYLYQSCEVDVDLSIDADADAES